MQKFKALRIFSVFLPKWAGPVNKSMVKGESEMVLADFSKAAVLTGHGGLENLVRFAHNWNNGMLE